MLVISRQLNQVIQIGPDIRVTVCRIGSQKVKLGIEAPPDVAIVRTELLPRIAAEQAQKRAEDLRPMGEFK